MYYLDEGDCVARAENTLFRFHSSHLQRDTTYFDSDIAKLNASSGGSPVGSTNDNPLALDDVRAPDFENLLWFFYESAYKWSDPVDATLTPKWESILALAEKFSMRCVAKVACHALDSANALGDVRKIALAVKHGLGKEWVLEELKHTVSRDAPLTSDEVAEIGSPTLVASLAAAHGLLHPLPPAKAPGCDPLDLDALECRACNGLKTCDGRNHTCPPFNLHTTPCPKRDGQPLQAPLPNVETVLSDVDLGPTPKGTLVTFHAEVSVFSVDPYSLRRASEVFAGMISIPKSSDSATEGSSAAEPINVDVKAHLFRGFVWFIYDSPYEWTHEVDPTSADQWENVLAFADIFGMDEIARVAVYALDRHYSLSDIRKISLCIQHDIGISWAMEAIKRVCLRKDPLSKAEARALGLDVAVDIAAARDAAFLKARPIISTAENILFRFHFYHLYRATSFFDKYIATLESPEGGYSDAKPLLLDKVKARDFEHLLWFFYESAYKWSGIVDQLPSTQEKWESILLLAERYKMRQVAKVACYALGRASALGDVRKIALCVKHDMGKEWITEELMRVISRDEPISVDEARYLSPMTMAVLCAARESMRYKPSLVVAPACKTYQKCTICVRESRATCKNGVHDCSYTGSHMTVCPARDRFTLAAELPEVATIVQDLNLDVPQPVASSLIPRIPLKDTRDTFFKVQDDILSVHSYHLKKASKTFADMFGLPTDDASNEGRLKDNPIVLSVKAQQFEHFIWFLYESPYAWTYQSDSDLTKTWEDVLALGDMFNMPEVCSVATYALDHNGDLPDIRKISLCVRHNIPASWALEAIKRICLRQGALTVAEARDIGLDMTATIASLREWAFETTYGGGVSPSYAFLRPRCGLTSLMLTDRNRACEHAAYGVQDFNSHKLSVLATDLVFPYNMTLNDKREVVVPVFPAWPI
ncbi:uncharacterized protein SCHCODRAFT_02486793 [Schizophyllum commune H4-8]|uniref:uncharacterized protein n=1 Tax=Schizophyllum commune (strain H4-8 / FGSC 9210) TaxID=578458 RepID=UPI002160C0B7|nr:uncharacterized protein SCHCODRAFT_02486793 [Schizophyllum commune H4-8]KAI5897542.1 hypothetical protein SCHCODRAFT_02486793 [Schizophyllum commune H4-8]